MSNAIIVSINPPLALQGYNGVPDKVFGFDRKGMVIGRSIDKTFTIEPILPRSMSSCIMEEDGQVTTMALCAYLSAYTRWKNR